MEFWMTFPSYWEYHGNILGISSSQLTFSPSFFRGVGKNHQPGMEWYGPRSNCGWTWQPTMEETGTWWGCWKKHGGYPSGKLTDDVFFSKTNGFWAFPIDAKAICRATFKTSGSGGTQLPQSLELGQPQVQRPQLHRKRARVGRVVRGCHRPGVERTLARTWCCGTQQISISLEIRWGF